MNKGKTLSLFGIIIILFGIMGYLFYSEINKSQEEIIIQHLDPICFTGVQIPLVIEPMELEETNDKETLLKLMGECRKRKIEVLKFMPEKNSINYRTHKKVIDNEIRNINKIYTTYKRTYEKILYEEELKRKRVEAEKKKKAEMEKVNSSGYTVAATIWKYLKNLGYNNYVCAGILGNIMAEVGGQTLNIRPYLYSSGGGYYGICQWSVKFYPSVAGKDLTTQLNFLAKTIKYEINTYGFKYYRGFNYNTFINLNSAQEAALAFAKAYERCASSYYGIRQANAIKAYKHFVG